VLLSGRREDRTGLSGRVQTSVRTCRIFVADAWYNFVQAFDRTSVRKTVEAIMAATAVQARTGPAHSGVRLTRRGRLAVVVSVLGLMVVGFSATGHVASQAASSTEVQHARTVTVQPGESLWAVAVRVAPHADPRLVVARIAQINHLAGAQVQAGQLLRVPVVS
jgi:LysM repeat protein